MVEETIAERVRPLAQAFHDSGLVRLCVRDGDFEVEFKRAPSAEAQGRSMGSADAVAARPAEAIVADGVGIVRFLRPPVVEGQTVEEDGDLAFVETLGIRTGVRSRGPGRVAAIYVSDGQPVEYGQPLFAIER
jgi:acetyl-CoA carboxylase biotin carboxyl carrier protein